MQLRARSFTWTARPASAGRTAFDALHRRGTVSAAMLYVFDLLELEPR